ncbi:hypothetical protein A3C26_02965 [Candidatus Daviesbacteria bacterium RIFCSPHIGHO2_02_FULL_39_12]|uniref:Uncharacterized protein n=2 Tax=Candidatus Daviesiibacteriota TaxID=1752718 RepID=A0A1F5JE12_9BACT|nr:MAG: hypothetical protein A3C26_02965 [Candidatus Daviesbacteria bacterium RIFCSPHIGHO2_02_FULL_39_12]OGE71455.1 MAG: hypothetical protein A3H40_02920 [Candidatus Daviesbacteria bacterium RIFCSPLOWO2_02_FULL_38_15]
MKLLLLHGPAISSSRAQLISIKQKFNVNDVVVFEQGADLEDIAGNLVSTSLFPQERLVILENPPADFIFHFSLFTFHFSLVLWFDHELPKAKLLEYTKIGAQVFYFPESKEITGFPFLDLLANKDNRAFLEMEKLKKTGFDIFYLLTMSYYLLRNLVTTPKNAPQFVKDKLQRQRKNFDLERITKLYKSLIEIEFKLKKGLLEQSQAEFLLVNQFTEN